VYWLLFDKAVRKEGNGPLKPFAGFAPAFTGPAPAGVRSCDNTALPALTCNQEEVSEIRAIFDGEAFLHRHSLKEQFLKNASHYRILHLATHACLDDRDPMMHRIFFSDGSVTASELYHLPLRADLVVLSACNSGMGKLAKGEGFMSLSRAFAHAGVPSMVISLWSVEDCSTSTLMKYFYQHLKSGLSKDEALRQAKLQYLNDSGNLESNPFYWAGFVHMGDPIALEAGKAHAPYYAPLLFGGLVFAFGLAFLLLKTAVPTKR
jgi:CHAT domain-containing protein